MRVLVVHNEVLPGATPEDLDVLVQVSSVCAALAELGYQSEVAACSLDLADLRRQVELRTPDVVFNLVESLGGRDRLLFLVPALLEALGVPTTGSGSEALMVSTGKLTTRKRLERGGVPMPRLAASWPHEAGKAGAVDYDVIVKSAWEHGSRGLDDSCVLSAGTDLPSALAQLAPQLGGECLAEEFIDGREYNISLLEDEYGWRRLPPAEIVFDAFAADRRRIVGHRAKWQADSAEFRDTPRSFSFAAADRAEVERVVRLAAAAAECLELSGWARVDLRVGRMGEVKVLEANANPCLSPDAGYAAALAQAGIEWPAAVDAIVQTALRRGRGVADRASSEQLASGLAH